MLFDRAVERRVCLTVTPSLTTLKCVALTLQYYGHRKKLRNIGREDDLEKLNLTALKLARQVADSTGTLMAGNLSNSTIYDPDDAAILPAVREMFKVRASTCPAFKLVT